MEKLQGVEAEKVKGQEEPPGGWTEALGEAGSMPDKPRTNGYPLGEDHTVSSCETRVMAAFEQWVRRQAKRAIQEAEIEDGQEEASRMRSAYMADYGAGHYNFDGRHCRTARGDWPGLRYLLFLLLKRCHPNITEEEVDTLFNDHPKDCGAAIAWALGNRSAPSKNGATKK